MTRYLLAIAAFAAFCTTASVSCDAKGAEFSDSECERRISEPAVNKIITEVFKSKAEELARKGFLSKEFWAKNKDLDFAVCDNKASYDTFLVPDKGVVFDYQMVIFLFAQARALIVGRYLADGMAQFNVHEDLVLQFIAQGRNLNNGPLALIEKKAISLGATKAVLDGMIADEQFQRREQTVFLQALNFLSLHERCHAALDHPSRIAEMARLSVEEKSAGRQQLELDADRCAMDIINADESQSKGSPVSFFGVLMIVATQAIIANQPGLSTDRSHPSTRNRIMTARDIALSYIARSSPAGAEQYAVTIKGTAEYFDRFLEKIATPSRN